MEIICYACGRGEYPENTLEAIAHCQKVNAEWRVEIDLQMSKDGHLVLFHDHNLKRITDLNMNICDIPLTYINKLNAGYNFKTKNEYPFRNQQIRIPTLDEVLKRFPKVKFLFDIHTDHPRAINKIIYLIEKYQFQKKVVVVSKYDSIIKEFRKKRCDWTFGAPTKEAKSVVFGSFLYLDRLFPLQSDILVIPRSYDGRKLLNKRLLAHVKNRKKRIWVWLHEGKEVITVNSKNQYTKLLKFGVDGIFTEYPAKLFEELNEKVG